MNKGLDSLLDTIINGLREKTDFAGRWCIQFTEDCVDKLRDYAVTGKLCGYKCEYCEKFKWVIDRAKSYEAKLNIPWTDILTSWETNRDYWFLNYYQDCNQPKITSDKVRVFESVDQMLEAIGEKQFRCPACNGISTNPYRCNSGIKTQNGKECDWAVYGLLGDLGKGVFVYCKDKINGENIFMPISWE